jgi:hypothetical protein
MFLTIETVVHRPECKKCSQSDPISRGRRNAMQSRISWQIILVLHVLIDFGTLAAQQRNQVRVSCQGRILEGCPSDLVSRIDIDTMVTK